MCGGRTYDNYATVLAELDALLFVTNIYKERFTVIHGDAPGADTLAGRWAHQRAVQVEAFPADWDRHGKAAGPIRNRQMLDTNPDLVVAFPGGRGTADTVTEARRRGIKITEVTDVESA